MMVYFNEFSWNNEDLQACKNACRQIYNEWGPAVIENLDSAGYFGNLDIYEVLNE